MNPNHSVMQVHLHDRESVLASRPYRSARHLVAGVDLLVAPHAEVHVVLHSREAAEALAKAALAAVDHLDATAVPA